MIAEAARILLALAAGAACVAKFERVGESAPRTLARIAAGFFLFAYLSGAVIPPTIAGSIILNCWAFAVFRRSVQQSGGLQLWLVDRYSSACAFDLRLRRAGLLLASRGGGPFSHTVAGQFVLARPQVAQFAEYRRVIVFAGDERLERGLATFYRTSVDYNYSDLQSILSLLGIAAIDDLRFVLILIGQSAASLAVYHVQLKKGAAIYTIHDAAGAVLKEGKTMLGCLRIEDLLEPIRARRAL